MESAAQYWNAAAETYEQDFAGTVIGRTRRSTRLAVVTALASSVSRE